MDINMIKEQLEYFLEKEGCRKIPSNLPEFTFFFMIENGYVNVYHVIDYRDGIYISEDQYMELKKKIVELFLPSGVSCVHILSLILCEDIEKAKRLCGEDTFCWIINPIDNELFIDENRVSDFYGIRNKMKDWLSHPAENTEERVSAGTKEMPAERWKNLSWVTFFLVFINILIFVICTFTGDLLYNKGVLSAGIIIEAGEYYRLISCMFLHWDMNHMVSNMLVLYYLGEEVEKYFGHLGYAAVYFFAGIAGNLLSIGYEIYTKSYVLSAGASGAVFGIIGALLFLVITHKGRLEQITLGRLLFMIAYSLYSGFVGDNINNAAHLGGFLGGICIAFALWLIQRCMAGRKEVDYEG